MQFTKCKSDKKSKNVIIRELQVYKCKECGCNYTLSYREVSNKEKKRRFTLSIYLEGLGFHSIRRLLGVSHVSVLNWVRKYGGELSSIHNPRPAEIIEMDKLHSYLGHKKLSVDLDWY